MKISSGFWTGVILAGASLAGGKLFAASAPASPERPSAYPSGWDVVFAPATPPPADEAFGRQTKILKKGTVFLPAARPLPCDIRWDRDVPIKLRDGVTIYTDILRPVGGAKAPAIVAWSPYGKTIAEKGVQSGVDPKDVTGLSKSEGPDAGFWVCHGYAVVNPDTRGAGRSQGDIYAWGSVDGQDGYDVIEWICMAPLGWPWRNGSSPKRTRRTSPPSHPGTASATCIVRI
jgi:hypothetical protein